MLTKVKTVALDGMKGELIEIETDISNGLPYFSIIGMADTSVRESTERVKRALVNSGFEYPKGKITVNLSPAYIHKRGSHFDLGIAIGLLLSQEILSCDIQNTLFIGELSLDGRILPVKGVLPMIMSVLEKENSGIKEIILPKDNCTESYLFTRNTEVQLRPAANLKDAVSHLQGERIEPFRDFTEIIVNDNKLDFSEVKGLENVKEAIMIAVAGNHNFLMIGPPGTGKTMLAKRIISLLTPMTLKEQIETTKIYSYAGKLGNDMPMIYERPFRHLTLGTTQVALIGGGVYPMPGEVSLAHNGVLFIDEMLDFPEKLLESLRVPIEDKEIHIVRKGHSVAFPSNFMLVGAANPCKCGFYGDSKNECTCSQTEINRYRSKLSGALMDRIDIAIEVSAIDYKDIGYELSDKYSSSNMLEVISRTREIQKSRYAGFAFATNGDMEAKYIDDFCRLDNEGKKFMESIYQKQHISMRRYHKILKIARTIGDINEKEILTTEELATAFHYTRFLTEKGR